jgi:acyl CoA:acetate/3-ketoacid CoA transferase alpha subunit
MEILSEGHPAFLHLQDIDSVRSYIREHRPRGLVNKVVTEQEAISKFVDDGDYIGIDNNMFQRGPSSLVREIIRQRKRNLGFCGKFNYADIALLAAADCIDRLDVGFIGVGLIPVTNRLNREQMKIAEWCNSALTMRLAAGSMGIPFIPARFLGGTGSYECSGARLGKDPFTGKEVVLLPALNPDVAIIHVNQCDIYGNARIFGCSPAPVELAGASKKVVLSTEEIIDTEEIRKDPSRTTIPCYLVDAVVKAPFGAYPGEVPGLYAADIEHITKLYQANNNKDEKVLSEYLDKYIYSVKSNDEFLEKRVGPDRLEELKGQMHIREGYYD